GPPFPRSTSTASSSADATSSANSTRAASCRRWSRPPSEKPSAPSHRGRRSSYFHLTDEEVPFTRACAASAHTAGRLKLLHVRPFETRPDAPLASEPERVLLEMLSEVGVRQWEARELVESANSLRPEVLREL